MAEALALPVWERGGGGAQYASVPGLARGTFNHATLYDETGTKNEFVADGNTRPASSCEIYNSTLSEAEGGRIGI